jgi:hypothetical protein
VVAPAVKSAGGNAAMAAAAGLMVAMIAAFSLTGRWPGSASLVRFNPGGIVDVPPDQISRVEIAGDGDQLVFRRRGRIWALDATEADAAVSDHVETALRFLHVSAPLRVLAAGEFDDADIGKFALDPPRQMIALLAGDGAVTTIGFGALNPAQTSHYVRVVGRSAVYLMSRHVGAEWQLAADMAGRSAHHRPQADGRAPASTPLLLPVSLARIWAVEIVAGGMLQRFERDAAGDWFHHVGEHVHRSSADAHVADPQLAKIIAGELAAFERTPIEQTVAETGDRELLARAGLVHPPLILLLYARDNPQPIARIGLGNLAKDSFHRYARSLDNATVVSIPAYAGAHLAALLRLAR